MHCDALDLQRNPGFAAAWLQLFSSKTHIFCSKLSSCQTRSVSLSRPWTMMQGRKTVKLQEKHMLVMHLCGLLLPDLHMTNNDEAHI